MGPTLNIKVRRSSTYGLPSPTNTTLYPFERSIDSSTLADRLQTESTHSNKSLLVIDCRPASSYNEEHIETAMSLMCPSLILRRMKSGRGSPFLCANSSILTKLVSTSAFSNYFYNGRVETVVLYAENDSMSSTDGNAVSTLVSVLQNEVPEVLVLRGGYSQFKKFQPEMCVSICTPYCIPNTKLNLPYNLKSETLSCKATRVLPYLYLGNQHDSSCLETLQDLGITHVLNVAKECSNSYLGHEGIEYKNIPMIDSISQDLSVGLEACFDFIEKARSARGHVLIHCVGGVSRSAAITLAFLMRSEGISLSDAYSRVKALRESISPNLGFMGQLQIFEQREATRRNNEVVASDLVAVI